MPELNQQRRQKEGTLIGIEMFLDACSSLFDIHEAEPKEGEFATATRTAR